MTKQIVSYSLQHILLMESTFHREWHVDFENPEFKNYIDIDVSDVKDDNSINVVVDLTFKAGISKDEIHINSKIKMIGVFEVNGEPELNHELFTKINGPAIIFPFLREHLSSLSLKAGIEPILLPPINFVKHNEEKSRSSKAIK